MVTWDIMYLAIGNLLKNKQVSKFIWFFKEFFVCCLLLGLEYIHINSILHRDIKPENLVLDNKGKLVLNPVIGYVRITDFGIAKLYQKENSSETSGTPGYMAPEVMCAQNHTIAVDYFALGVMTYEFMMGRVNIYKIIFET